MSEVSERIKNMVRRTLAGAPETSNQDLYDKAVEMEPSIADLTLRQFNARYPLQVRRWELTSADDAREKARAKRVLEQPSEQPVRTLPALEWSAGGFTSKPGGRPTPGRGMESSPKWPFAREPEPAPDGDEKSEQADLLPATDGNAASAEPFESPATPRRPPVQLVPDDDDDDVEAEVTDEVAEPAARPVTVVAEEDEFEDEEEVEILFASGIRPGDEVREILLELAGRVVDAEGAIAWMAIGSDLDRYASRIVELAED
jgi:hypothetical protein